MERLELLAGRFEMKASKHDEWMQGKPEKLSDNRFDGLSLSEVTVCLNCLFIYLLFIILLSPVLFD